VPPNGVVAGAQVEPVEHPVPALVADRDEVRQPAADLEPERLVQGHGGVVVAAHVQGQGLHPVRPGVLDQRADQQPGQPPAAAVRVHHHLQDLAVHADRGLGVPAPAAERLHPAVEADDRHPGPAGGDLGGDSGQPLRGLGPVRDVHPADRAAEPHDRLDHPVGRVDRGLVGPLEPPDLNHGE
jgi:hypothetical protein